MANGKQGEALLEQRMRDMGYTVENVSTNSEYYYKGDFKITSPITGATKIFECKWDSRINQTGNLYLELTNIHSKGGQGWWSFCQADFLAYGDGQAQVFYIFSLAELKERVQKIGGRRARCGNDSEGLLVSLDSIKDLMRGVI